MAIGLTSIIVAIVAGSVPLIGAFFQKKSAIINEKRNYKQTKVKRSEQIFNNINASIGALAFLNTQVMLFTVFNHDSAISVITAKKEDLWQQYQNELIEWKRHKAKYKAEIKTYFSEEISLNFLEILTIFDRLEKQVDATYNQRTNSSDFLVAVKGHKNNFRIKYFKKLRDPLDDKVVDLNIKMLETIKTFSKKNIVT